MIAISGLLRGHFFSAPYGHDMTEKYSGKLPFLSLP